MKEIVIKGRVTQLGEDDEGRPAVWIDSGHGGYRGFHRLFVSRAQCSDLAEFLYGEEVEILIRTAPPGAPT